MVAVVVVVAAVVVVSTRCGLLQWWERALLSIEFAHIDALNSQPGRRRKW